MDFDVDFFVIGAGSGGVRASRVAARHGARVMIAEEDRFGGTCVIRGCVPKKLSVQASGVSSSLARARDYGWRIAGADFDYAQFKRQRDLEVARLEGLYRTGLEAAGVRCVEERATLAGTQVVQLASGKRVRARHVLLATGGRPAVPPFEGCDAVDTSDDFFTMESLPRRVIVVGGGYIAVEFACIFFGLGCDVQLVYRGEQILRGFDNDLREAFASALSAKGLPVHLMSPPRRVLRDSQGLTLEIEDGRTFKSERIFYATGREAQTDNLGLEALGLSTGERGYIDVDDGGTTALPWLHAVGDIVGRAGLTPVAIRQGQNLADRLFGGTSGRGITYAAVPSAVFSQPEIGVVGLSEAGARDEGYEIDVYTRSFRSLEDSFSPDASKVFMKMVTRRGGGKILGVHLMGPHAAEIIQLAAVAVNAGLTKADFDATVAVHPSLAEELVTLTG